MLTILTGICTYFICNVKTVLHSTFTIKDLGLVKYYLGLEIHRTETGLYLHQHQFVHDLLIVAGLENSKPLLLLVDINIKLSLMNGVLLDKPSVIKNLSVNCYILLFLTQISCMLSIILVSFYRPRVLLICLLCNKSYVT